MLIYKTILTNSQLNSSPRIKSVVAKPKEGTFQLQITTRRICMSDEGDPNQSRMQADQLLSPELSLRKYIWHVITSAAQAHEALRLNTWFQKIL